MGVSATALGSRLSLGPFGGLTPDVLAVEIHVPYWGSTVTFACAIRETDCDETRDGVVVLCESR